ncbi:hypothetical protein [Streptomyces sp. AD55]|uniref:hypothetical protein n=1 Tax=Streptomyces sp. AD55 TaxID=3242895 RepID=UPI0035298993
MTEGAATTDPAGAGAAETAERAARSTADAGSESVEIPKQQTAGDAADEAADKSART